MKFHVCPTCQRPVTRKINVGGVKRQALYDYVAAHPDGISAERIMAHVYQLDPNGGPESSNVISVTVFQINKTLMQQRRGVKIVGGRGIGQVYKLVAL